MEQKLKEVFGFAEFKPHQRAVCEAVTAGCDVLLVMPTGAGKSLCYQLPGLMRQGTALVISPLIALMEDQVTKLQALGLRAEALHGGQDRETQQNLVHAHRAGKLDFLFLTPERLSLLGFPEALAVGKIALVAIDEAHCLSHWGHDFRPEYRFLKDRIEVFRPAPVIALTATATLAVQKDIIEQLGLTQAQAHIHGFARTNLAIEVMESTPQQRVDTITGFLAKSVNLPALVYTASRKQTEMLEDVLKCRLRARAYHAGMPVTERHDVQRQFLHGELDVVVATVAFGMGIDKANIRSVIHAGLPGSLEGYYQEIGRAGRDGNPARVILLHAPSDRRTHEFLLEKNYPAIAQLEQIVRQVRAEGTHKSEIASPLPPLEYEVALEKLRVFGGVTLDEREFVYPGKVPWQRPYLRYLEFRKQQLLAMEQFAAASGSCRMQALVRYFGDDEDDSCGICDICQPSGCAVKCFRKTTRRDTELFMLLKHFLSDQVAASASRIYRSVFTGLVKRKELDDLLAGLVQGGLLRSSVESMVKNGHRIHFRSYSLTPAGRAAATATLTPAVAAPPPVKARLASSQKSGFAKKAKNYGGGRN